MRSGSESAQPGARIAKSVWMNVLVRAVDSGFAAIAVVDPQWNVQYANATFGEITGYSAEEVDGLNIAVLQSGHTPLDQYAKMNEALAAGCDWQGEFLNRRKDGTLYWDQTLITPIRNPDGSLGGYLILKQAVTARKNAEILAERASREMALMRERVARGSALHDEIVQRRTAALRSANERLTTTLNSAFDVILVLTSTCTIEFANEATTRLLGYRPEELLGITPGHFVDVQYVPRLERALTQVLETGVPQQVQGLCVHRDGHAIECDFALTQVAGGSGVVCSIRDITTLKTSEKLKDRFVSMVNHELRQPISILLLSVGKLQAYYERMSDDQRKTTVRQMHQQTQMMNELVESILDLTRLDTGTVVRNQQQIDVAAVGAAVMDEARSMADVKHISVTMNGFAASRLSMSGDLVDVKRIWRNLISNAIKYTPEGGAVAISYGEIAIEDGAATPVSLAIPDHCMGALPAGQYIVGSVQDTGYGIPPQDIDLLFGRFFRGWAAQSGMPGTGLGLALVRELLESYGGQIHVTSEVGSGSTFTFIVPATVLA